MPRDAVVGQRRIAQDGDIAAGTEPPPLAVIDDDRVHVRRVPPSQQRVGHGLVHGRGQRVDRLGAIEREVAGDALAASDKFFGHRSKSRPIIIRMISLVPSRMRWTLRSRQKRSIG